MAIYSQLSLAKKNVKMAIYSQKGYYLSYNTGKTYLIIYHVGSARHYFLEHIGIFCFFMVCIFHVLFRVNVLKAM